MSGRASCDCRTCETRMQPYLDRELSESEQREVASHLADCDCCRRYFRYEEALRRYVKQVCCEPISSELKDRLDSLRASAT